MTDQPPDELLIPVKVVSKEELMKLYDQPTARKDADVGPHESWCDTQNKISEYCNCVASSYIDQLDDLRRQLEQTNFDHDVQLAQVRSEKFDAEVSLKQCSDKIQALEKERDELKAFIQKYSGTGMFAKWDLEEAKAELERYKAALEVATTTLQQTRTGLKAIGFWTTESSISDKISEINRLKGGG